MIIACSYIRIFCSCEKKAWKIFRLVRDSNPWPMRDRCSALPIKPTESRSLNWFVYKSVNGWWWRFEYMKIMYVNCGVKNWRMMIVHLRINSSICSPHNYMIFIYSKLQNKISWKAKIGLEVKRRGREKITWDVRISISNEGAFAE